MKTRAQRRAHVAGVAWLPALLALLPGCSSFHAENSTGPLVDAASVADAPTARDASRPVDARGAADARDSAAIPPRDAGGDTDANVRDGGSRSDGAPVDASPDVAPFDSGLSPGVVAPPASGTPCDPAQGDDGCPSGETCRIASPTGGRCDNVTAGAEGTSPCAVDSDCDDTLQCWNGECKVLCPLGMTCLGGCECSDVGNATTGLCCSGS